MIGNAAVDSIDAIVGIDVDPIEFAAGATDAEFYRATGWCGACVEAVVEGDPCTCGGECGCADLHPWRAR